MQTQITFRHTNGQHPNLKESAQKMADNLLKFHDGIISSHIEFNNETTKQVVINLHVEGGTLVAKEESDDFRKSLTAAGEKMKRQLKKFKAKHNDVRSVAV